MRVKGTRKDNWTEQELAILAMLLLRKANGDLNATETLKEARRLIPHRSWAAIQNRFYKLRRQQEQH